MFYPLRFYVPFRRTEKQGDKGARRCKYLPEDKSAVFLKPIGGEP